MSTRQRVTRATLVVVAFACGALCLLAAGTLASDVDLLPLGESMLLAVLWVSGLTGFGVSIAACRVDGDSTDDPHYFGTIVQGLRDEWHHDSAA
jgi:hypothetical protein